jgi:hypothetical protein
MARVNAFMLPLLLWTPVTVPISVSVRPGTDAGVNPAQAAPAGGSSGW